MRIGVLADSASWYLADLERAAAGRHALRRLSFSDLSAQVGADPPDVDAVLVRTMPAGSLEQVVFRMDLLEQWRLHGVSVVNPPKAVEAAVDKYLCSARLHAAGLLIPPTIACQTWKQACEAFERFGGDVVVKPIFGGEGRGLLRVEDAALAARSFKTLERLQQVIYCQPFVRHYGYDVRVLCLGQQAFFMRRRAAEDWRTNISQGGTAEAMEPNAEMAALARRAADAVGAPFAGVDLLPARDGQVYVLEVNAVPGWKALQRATGHDIAAALLEFLESTV